MRKFRSMLFLVAFLLVCSAFVLVFCALSRADENADVVNISKLRKDAQNTDSAPPARVMAVKQLGKFQTGDPLIQKALRDVFKELLNDPQGPEFVKNYIRYYTVKALGDIGSRMNVEDLISDLGHLVDSDKNLNDAVKETLAKINNFKAQQPPKLPSPSQKNHAQTMIDVLQDKDAKGELLRLAALEIDKLNVENKLSESDKKSTVKALGDIMKRENDAITQCIIKTLKKKLEK